MSISEKLTKIAENVTKVYEAGQKSMVDESKIIEKTVSGSVIAVDDVSEVPHDVAVQLSSDTVTNFSGVEVDVISKNLFDKTAYPLTVGKELWATSGSVSNNSANTMASTLDYISCHNLRELTITISHTYGSNMGVAFYDGSKAFISGVSNNGGTKITATVPDTAIYYRFCMNAVYIDVAQVEVGAVSTDYEPYIKKTYTAEADGTVKGIKSISPNMTIFTEMEGINISATYHKSWGMQTEYDRFWDDFQKEGSRNAYQYAFTNWDGAYIKPKYKIVPTSGGMQQMFYGNTNLKKIEAKYFDFSNLPVATYAGSSLYYTFQFCSSLEEIEDVGITADFMNGTFHGCSKLHTIAKLTVKETTTFSAAPFHSCTALEEIRFDGVVGNSIDLHWSTKLSFESLASIVGALSDTVTGQTITLPTTAESTYDNATFAGRWKEIVASKPNWTFAYA